MSYAAQSVLANDEDFIDRCGACAAVEIHALVPGTPTHPLGWAREKSWYLAAAPGFADAYEYALNTGNERPGADGAVITDGQILAAVQALLADYPPEPEATP